MRQIKRRARSSYFSSTSEYIRSLVLKDLKPIADSELPKLHLARDVGKYLDWDTDEFDI